MRISDNTLNRLAVLKAIRLSGPIARSELPRVTGLSGGTITQLTSDLIDRGLVIERKDVSKTFGRPRQYLEINADGTLVVGASLAGASKLNIAFVSLTGIRLYEVNMSLGYHQSLASMASAIGEAIARAITESPFDIGDISRVGMAIPALVNSAMGEVHYMTTFPNTGPVAFAQPISERLGLPVTIENDLTCMARAEHWFGHAREIGTFSLVHAGFAIGLAEYEEGLPKTGANGLNAELGHVKSMFSHDARKCVCGGHGCLNAYASMYGILQGAQALGDAPFPPTDSLEQRFGAYLDLAKDGDVNAREALEQAGKLLGLALGNLINASDPGNLLISFANHRFQDAVSKSMMETILANVMPGVMPSTKIEIIAVAPDWRSKGAAALALEQTFLGSSSFSAKRQQKRSYHSG